MNKDQEQKPHVCRFCNQNFSNGRKLGGHMRRHLALISACRTKDLQKSINGEKGLDVYNDDDRIIKRNQGINHDYDTGARKQSIQEHDQEIINDEIEHDSGANVYVLRQNPKRSWRVSSSIKDHNRRCDSRNKLMKNTVCKQCGKVFDSLKALYGHMRCHSIKRSRPLDESSSLSSSDEHEHDEHDVEVANPVKKKRSCTRYKSSKHDHLCTSWSSDDDYDEVEKGAICLMMLSRGVRSLNGSGQLDPGLKRI